MKTTRCGEIIDGQQRLTTIYILYKYLMTKEGISDEELEEDYGGKKTVSSCICHTKRFSTVSGGFREV